MVDVHCHIGTNIDDNEVIRIICGTDLDSSIKAVNFANNYLHVWACIGIHPEEYVKTGQIDEYYMDKLKQLAINKKVVGIGEVGLDYRNETTREEKEKQKDLFNHMIKLAIETELPIVVHNRNADEDIYQSLKPASINLKGVLMHCFTRNLEYLERMTGLGAYFSYGGFILNKDNMRIIKDVINTPEDRLLLETDAPSGVTDVKIVARAMAKLRNMAEADIVQITDKNAHELFRLMI